MENENNFSESDSNQEYKTETNNNSSSLAKNKDVNEAEMIQYADADLTHNGKMDVNPTDVTKINHLKKSKKRVNFLPDANLVMIREISPRSTKNLLDSDDSSESSSESESSGSDESDSESCSSDDSDTSSEKENKEKQNKVGLHIRYNLNTTRVSQKINQTLDSKKTDNSIHSKNVQEAIKEISVPIFQKREKIISSPDIRKPVPVTKSTAIKKVKIQKRTTNTQRKLIKSNNSKIKKSTKPTSLKSSFLSERPSRYNQKLSVPISAKTTKVTSITILPDKTHQNSQSFVTVNGFIFPSADLAFNQLPYISQNTASTNQVTANKVSKKVLRRHSEDLELPKEANFISLNLSSSFDSSYGRENYDVKLWSANQKRKRYAWKMANGSIGDTLNTTPSIAQLWETEKKSL